ncbi:MAG: ABC transporter ATP-binding protein [Thiotrichales bacterium]|nr:ABC transporter ATP-binding protein [Thiotrichales bacterium]
MFFDPRLWQFTRGVRLRIAATVAMGVFASLVGIGRLALLGWLLARVFAGDTFSDLVAPFALVAAVMVLRGWIEHARAMIAHRTAVKVQLALRRQLYDKVVTLGPSWFGLERTGAVMISMIDGVEQLETYFGEYLPQLLVSFITPIVVFVLLAFLDLPVAALMFAFAMFTLFGPVVFQGWDAKSSMRRSKAYRGFAAEFLDAIQGLATLKAFGQSAERGRRLAERAQEVFRSTMWVLATNSLTRGLTDTGIAVGSAAVLAFGAWRVTQGQMGLDVLLIVLMMGIEVFRPQRDLRALLHNGMMGRAAADDIFAVLNAHPRVEPPATPVECEGPLAPVVEFDDVSFAYPGGRRAAHRALSFRVEPGERVGFVGESGAGKSTIVRLLLRFHDPDEGVVRIGGHDLRTLRPDDIYRNIAVVNQDPYLFHGTVEENLRFGRPDATGEDIEEAARAANAHEFISRLPQGYGSVIGERGIKLSGGQRQRIAIARALLRDAPILVLDEALSAVDAENEAVIQSALDRLMQGRTTLIFAHRLSSVIGADRILVLDHGSIVEAGDHPSLMRAGGAYHRLMGAQAEESAESGVSLAAPSVEPVPRRDVPLEDLQADEASAHHEPTDAILRAEGLSWAGAFRELLRYVVPWKVKLSVVLGFGIIRVVALIGVGVASALAVAAVKQGEPFTQYLVVLAIIAPLAGVLHWLESWFAHDMAFRMLAEMRIALYRKLDRLAPAYLVRRRTGDLVGMATQDVELVEYFFAHTVAPFFVAVLVPAVVIGSLGWFGWPMALALVPFLAVVALSPFLARHRIDEQGSRAREAFGDLNAHAVDTIQGLPEILAFQRSRARAGEFVARIERHATLRLSFFSDLTRQTAILEAATGLGGLVVVMTGAHLAGAGALEPAILPMLVLLAMSAFLPVSEIAHIGRQLADTLGATRRLYAVYNEVETVRDGAGVPVRSNGVASPEATPRRPRGDTPSSPEAVRSGSGAPSGRTHQIAGSPAGTSGEPVRLDPDSVGASGVARPEPGPTMLSDSDSDSHSDSGGAARSPAGGIEIEVRDVSFSYFGNRRLALDGATFAVPAGSTLALVGPSGAGKTTVAHLLMRFWDPGSGVIRFDGHDLREYRLDDLRDRVALVTQDTYLFNETLRSNILLARPEATDAELGDAVRRASLDAFVEALPDGLETRVGERGVRLSGGQRQRVAIARAFLKDAPVLILDEATSHLDAVNEQAVRHALEVLMSDRTTIVIAHRLSTVRTADRIVVLDAGRTEEAGTHDELIAHGGLYRRLVRRQMTAGAGTG